MVGESPTNLTQEQMDVEKAWELRTESMKKLELRSRIDIIRYGQERGWAG
jgi:hypothetical protein